MRTLLITIWSTIIIGFAGAAFAEVSICDAESGAAYGLCNAYTNGMKCDTDNPESTEQACTRVSDKFTQITGRPIIPILCPCATTNFSSSNNRSELLSSTDVSCTIDEPTNYIFIYDSPDYMTVDAGYCSTNYNGAQIHNSVNEDEAAACMIMLRDIATDAGLTCN